MKDVPAGYRRIAGSERQAMPNARLVGPADPGEIISVSIYVRRRPESPAMPDFSRPGERRRVSREEFAALYGAHPSDLDRVAAFARAHGFTVTESSSARRTVVLSGTVEQMSRAFAVELSIYDTPSGRYRGREGAVSIPEEIADIVQAVLGLDNRPVGRPHIRAAIAPQAATPLTPPAVAALYDFPASVSAAGQTIGILEFGGGYKISDIQTFFKGLNLTTPTVTSVGVDGATNSPGAPADAEVALDIDVAGSVAQGANIVVYFAPNTEQGYADCISYAAHDAKSQPSVLSISWGGVESNFTAAGMVAISAQLQAASVVGVTVFSTSGDNGSADVTIDGKAHVLYPGSDPWITCCGGTSISNVSGASFTEKTWNQTGGGISDVFDLPDWQSQAGVPASANKGHRIGRGVPDISGNADPNSGYVLTLGGAPSGPYGGTSAVAPFYAGLVALVNANLGEPAGYLNYNLYAFDGSNVYRDIADSVSNASGPAPGYRSGAGWDACTGFGSINGNALLDALRGVGLPVALASYNGNLYMAWKGMERDERIFWSVFDGKSWAAQQQVSGVSTSAGPALEVFDGKLYMAWKGMADDQRIWYSYFDGSKWAPQKQAPGVSTSTGPSLGVYVDKLYMAWKGMEGDQGIWYSYFDGGKWAPQQAVPGVSTSVGPCITTFAGELHMAWKGMYGDQRIWFSHFDGVRWAAQQTIPGVSTTEGPQLCPYNGRLYAVWKGMDGDERLWYSHYDSTAWAAQQHIPGVSSSVGAGLMEFESVLYAAWKGMLGDQRIWYAYFNGANWGAQSPVPGVGTSPHLIAMPKAAAT